MAPLSAFALALTVTLSMLSGIGHLAAPQAGAVTMAQKVGSHG